MPTTTTPRMRQIAEDLQQEGAYTSSNSVWSITLERDALREALELAQSHIGWCWDKLEENTRMRREGSASVHNRIKELAKAHSD